jgi:hypothetical protein
MTCGEGGGDRGRRRGLPSCIAPDTFSARHCYWQS